MRRAAVSIPINIVEGSTRHSEKAFLSFLTYAYGSTKELDVLLSLSKDLGYIDKKQYSEINEKLDEIMAKLFKFMNNIEKVRTESRTHGEEAHTDKEWQDTEIEVIRHPKAADTKDRPSPLPAPDYTHTYKSQESHHNTDGHAWKQEHEKQEESNYAYQGLTHGSSLPLAVLIEIIRSIRPAHIAPAATIRIKG